MAYANNQIVLTVAVADMVFDARQGQGASGGPARGHPRGGRQGLRFVANRFEIVPSEPMTKLHSSSRGSGRADRERRCLCHPPRAARTESLGLLAIPALNAKGRCAGFSSAWYRHNKALPYVGGPPRQTAMPSASGIASTSVLGRTSRHLIA